MQILKDFHRVPITLNMYKTALMENDYLLRQLHANGDSLKNQCSLK